MVLDERDPRGVRSWNVARAGDATSPGPADIEIDKVAFAPVLLVMAIVALAHAAIATRFGWHRDEFYYVTSGRHLAWGYVDQPPLTPVLARVAASVSTSLWPLRAVVIVLQAATIGLGALVAREMGGGRRAQTLAAACIAGCPIFVGASLFLGTTPTDQFMWALVFFCLVRALRTGRVEWWIAVGLAAGIGLENKHTVAILLAGMVVGFAFRQRALLRTRGPWIAGAVALVVWMPNLWWDATHHWETLDMARKLSDKTGGAAGAFGQLPLLLFVFPGPFIFFILWRGIRRAAPRRAEYAWLVPTAVVVVVAVTLAGGKPYYAAPLFVPFFALGSVETEQRGFGDRPWLSATATFVAASIVVSALLGLPYLSPSFETAIRPLAKEPMETYGWQGFAAQVARAEAATPTAIAIYAGNYGEAGALEKYRTATGIALPVVVGQNAYRDWGPPTGTPTDVIAVGEFDRRFLLQAWNDVEPIAPIALPKGLKNEETEEDATIFRCRDPLGSWSAMWSTLSYLS